MHGAFASATNEKFGRVALRVERRNRVSNPAIAAKPVMYPRTENGSNRGTSRQVVGVYRRSFGAAFCLAHVPASERRQHG